MLHVLPLRVEEGVGGLCWEPVMFIFLVAAPGLGGLGELNCVSSVMTSTGSDWDCIWGLVLTLVSLPQLLGGSGDAPGPQ